MGRKYGRGLYSYGTYDLGVNEVNFTGALSFEIKLSGKFNVDRVFAGAIIHVPIRITSIKEYFGPYWEEIGIGDDIWTPAVEPPDFWTPIAASESEFWVPITEPPPQFKV